ncbi:hypothetical protein HY02_08415 [Peptococcaceae bacterium SCADC1_2_3]|nr:hypothetical protein DK28_0214460 [Peptococcaceae bacterium SCADC1_2_3]KFI38110.1 hypothetical protein HY02_08415 [Peptococcaceae bacterium SCADC1_2_3]
MLEMQVEILLKVINFCLGVFIWIVPAMLVVNVLLELGVLKKFIAPAGWFFARFANLPPEVAAAFISSFGSSYAGGSMLVNLQERGLLTSRQTFLAALTFSVPLHVREIFSYYLPVAFPLLGMVLGAIYLGVHTATILVKVFFVMLVGKLTPGSFIVSEKAGEKKTGKELSLAFYDGLSSCLRPLKRMALTIPLTAWLIFELNALGVFEVIPIRGESLGLPPCSTACLVSYLASPLVGLASLAACFHGGEMTMIQAIRTMLWGSLLSGSVLLVRFSGTYYLGVYGPVLGMKLSLASFVISSAVYASCLIVAQIG